MEKYGTEFRINTEIVDDQYDSSVTGLTNGGFIVTWTSDNQAGDQDTGIHGQLYNSSGNTVGDELHINTTTNLHQYQSSVTGLTGGGFSIIWTSNGSLDDSEFGIYGQLYDSSGAKVGSEFHVNTYIPFRQHGPSVTGLIDGGFVVTWTATDHPGDPSDGIYGQLYNSNGTTVGGEFHINTYTNSYQYGSSVTGLTDGGFVVTWTSYNQPGDPSGGIYGQIYNSSGTPVDSEIHINTYTISGQFATSVTGLTDGGFVVIWTSQDQFGDQEGGIFGQIYNSSGVPIGDEIHINTYTSSWQAYPAVTGLTDGGFVVTWTSFEQDGHVFDIYGQLYYSNGVPNGDESLINTYRSNEQSYSSVAGLKNGGFVVTWTSNQDEDQEERLKDIYGQIYEVIPICFKKGSKVLIDNVGYKNIEDVQRGDCIKQNKVLGVVSQQLNGKIVKINKHAIAFNVPCVDTYVTHGHKLHYNTLTFIAKDIINGTTVIEEEINETVYNILLDKFIYDTMKVNNLEAETLHPMNPKAIIFYKNYVAAEIKNKNPSVLRYYTLIREFIH